MCAFFDWQAGKPSPPFLPYCRLTCSFRAAGRAGCFFWIFGCSSCPSSDFDGLLPLIYDVRNYQRKCHHHQKQPSRPSQQPGSEVEGSQYARQSQQGGQNPEKGLGTWNWEPGIGNWDLGTRATALGKQWAGQCQRLWRKSNPCGSNCGPAPGSKCNVWELLNISLSFSQFQALGFVRKQNRLGIRITQLLEHFVLCWRYREVRRSILN